MNEQKNVNNVQEEELRVKAMEHDVSDIPEVDVKMTYHAIEDGVVGTYHKIEDAVVGGYKKIEDGIVGGFPR